MNAYLSKKIAIPDGIMPRQARAPGPWRALQPERSLPC